jgi:hypothetical protein
MNIALDILAKYWGLIVLVVGLVVWAIRDWASFRSSIGAMILYVEKNAETLVLENGQAVKDGKAKHDWVAEQMYPLLPAWLKGFVSEQKFHDIIEAIFQRLIALAEKNRH